MYNTRVCDSGPSKDLSVKKLIQNEHLMELYSSLILFWNAISSA